jgi:hypothetical protein
LKKLIKNTWDNIHWWGGFKKTHIPSAPGAFHAAHIHWRWGLFIQQFSSQKQFKGTHLGGPLIDPNIRLQTMKFAIAKNTNTIINREFEKSFIKNQNLPQIVKDGTNICLWISLSANRDNTKPLFQGTFFIHGIFFAHDIEPSYFSNRIFQRIASGTRKEEYIPAKPAQVWVRNPK